MSDSYNVIYSPQALNDLKDIYAYIAQELFVPDTARNQVNRIRKEKGLPEKEAVNTTALKEEQYRKLGEYTRKYLDMDYIMNLIEGDK